MQAKKRAHQAMLQPTQFPRHIADVDLERYQLGTVKSEAELATLEEHLLACPSCIERAEAAQCYLDALRAAILVYRGASQRR
jgi:hypothetical protein